MVCSHIMKLDEILYPYLCELKHTLLVTGHRANLRNAIVLERLEPADIAA